MDAEGENSKADAEVKRTEAAQIIKDVSGEMLEEMKEYYEEKDKRRQKEIAELRALIAKNNKENKLQIAGLKKQIAHLVKENGHLKAELKKANGDTDGWGAKK